MAKAVVPVVIKLLAEADSSIEGAVTTVRNSLKAASKATIDQLGASASGAAKEVAFKLSKSLSDIKIDIISKKATSLAKTGLQEVEASSKSLQQSLSNIIQKFQSVAGAAEDLRTSKPYEDLIKKAKELAQKQIELRKALSSQKAASAALLEVEPSRREEAKATLDKAKIVTRELQKEAVAIKNAYNKAFKEVESSLASLQSETEKAKKKAEQPVSVGGSKQKGIRGAEATELELIKQRFSVTKEIASSQEKINKITQDRLNLEQRISGIVSATEKARLQKSVSDLSSLGSRVSDAQRDSVAARQKAIKDNENLLAAQLSKSPNVQALKQVALQSKLTADALSADAKKAEQAYSAAFVKIKSEADKALNPKGVAGGRLASGLGIFSPIANQLGSAIDQVIGKFGPFGVSSGIQIGQAISQGIGQGLQDGSKTASEAVNSLIDDFKNLSDTGKQVVAGFATAFVVGSAAVAAALGGLSAFTVKVASDFEVLTAKLTTTFKSPTIAVERFQLALELAAKTPYNVEQVVSAQVQLSSLGQKNISILQATIDLASGLNADLARTANEVGKAAAGSLRGYQELRNTLGITQERLKQFGGVVDSQNRLMVRNEYQIKKNREALLALIRTDFGGSAERLSQTLQGRISNLEDEILKLAGAMGGGLLPQIKSGVEGATSFIQVLNSIPQPVKVFASGIVATSAVLFGFGAAIAATSLGLGVLSTSLTASMTPAVLAFAARIPLATTALTAMNFVVNTSVTSLIGRLLPAIVTTSGAFQALSASAASVNLATLAGPLAGIVALAGLLNSALNAQISAAEEAGRKIKAYSDEIANARRENKTLKQDLVEVFELPPEFLGGLDTTEQKIAKIQEEFEKRGALRLAQDVGLAGRTTEELLERFTRVNASLEVQEKRLKDIVELRQRIAEFGKAGDGGAILDALRSAEEAGVIPQITQEVQDLIDTDPGKAAESFDLFAQKLEKLANINIANLKPATAFLKQLTDGLSKIESVFDKSQKAITRAEGPAKFALKIGDINLINSALKEQIDLQKQLTKLIEETDGLREKSRKGTRFTIKEAVELKEGAVGPNKDLLEKFISTNDLITDLSNARVKVQAKADALSLQQLEAKEKRELAVLGKGSKERQLQIVEESIKVVKARADAYQKDLDEFVRLQGLLKTKIGPGLKFDIQNQLDRSTERIEAGKKAFDMLIDLEKKKASIIEQIESESLKKSKKILDEKYDATKKALDTFIADAKQIASGVRPTDISGKTTKSFIGIDGKTILSVQKPIEEFSDAALTASEKIEVFQNKLFELRTQQRQTDFAKFGDKGDDLKKAFRDAERELEEGLDRAKIARGKERIRSERVDETGKKKVVRENFADFKIGIGKEISEATNKAEQLKVVTDAIRKIEKERDSGNIGARQAKAEIVRLAKQQKDLEQDIARSIADQVKELEQIRSQRIKDEIDILEARKEGASGAERDALESQIKGRRKQQVQEQFNTLKAERDLELEQAKKNGKSQELILEKYAQKQEELLRKAYLDHQKTEQDKLKATTDRLKAEEDALKSFRDKRVGGAASPLISLEELSFQSTLPGFGSDAESRLERRQDGFSTPSSPFGRAKVPSFESFRAKFESDNNLNLGKDSSRALPSAFDKLQPISAPGAQQITNYISIDSKSVGDADIVKAGADLAIKAMQSVQKNQSLISGGKGGSISAKPFGAKPFGAKQIGSDAGFGFSL